MFRTETENDVPIEKTRSKKNARSTLVIKDKRVSKIFFIFSVVYISCYKPFIISLFILKEGGMDLVYKVGRPTFPIRS